MNINSLKLGSLKVVLENIINTFDILVCTCLVIASDWRISVDQVRINCFLCDTGDNFPLNSRFCMACLKTASCVWAVFYLQEKKEKNSI